MVEKCIFKAMNIRWLKYEFSCKQPRLFGRDFSFYQIVDGVMNFFFVTAIFLLTSIATTYGARWDHFIFAQEWPQTACTMGKKEEHKTCSIPAYINSFIIHGLWPSLGSKEGPKNCKSVPFVMSKIKNLTDELQHAWPNIFRKSRPSDFWKHEWNTHGTCALSLNTTGTEYLFFRKALDLIKTYNASKYLNKVNITPSDTTPYVTKTIENILKKKLGVMPNLQCYRYKSQSGKRKTDLAEIRICMDKQFKLIKCPHGDSTLYWSRLSQTQSCRGGEIYIPEIKRNLSPQREQQIYD
ncbi:ribonuclease T2 [Mytilus galloprovincialis]|uniref:Ribonuclease T2 n=1 Tax=Mytilus galloprovincialis TaxID=29158 RepID=A0A8B6GG29_MYTGA|nr:ribonuclease T2 [Mytilus galloprovincialis]